MTDFKEESWGSCQQNRNYNEWERKLIRFPVSLWRPYILQLQHQWPSPIMLESHVVLLDADLLAEVKLNSFKTSQSSATFLSPDTFW